MTESKSQKLNQNAKDVFPRRHAEISPGEVKDTHIINNNLLAANTSVWGTVERLIPPF